MAEQSELLKGTLDLSILRALGLEPRHGLGIAERIERVTRGTFKVKRLRSNSLIGKAVFG